MAKLVFGASGLAVVVAGLATVVWIQNVLEGNDCWAAFGFTMVATPCIGGILLLVLIPGAILYLRGGQRKDLISLLLAGHAFVFLFVETILLWVIEQRGEH